LPQPSIPITSLLQDPSESQTDPVVHAEKEVEAALNDLVATGALQTKNQMDLESLLNPEGESHFLFEASDEEIYQAVVDSIVARENIETNGGDDMDMDDIPIEACPTRRDILKAVSTISKYIDELNDPIARKLEDIFSSFKRQLRLDETRSMKATVLTDFFQRS
jgi:hypothetical protein